MTDAGDEHQEPQSGVQAALAEALQRLSRVEEAKTGASPDANIQTGLRQIIDDWPQMRQAILDIRDTLTEININLTRRV